MIIIVHFSTQNGRYEFECVRQGQQKEIQKSSIQYKC